MWHIHLQRVWKRFRQAEPGERFRRLYDRSHRRSGSGWTIGGLSALAAGVLLMIAGPIVGIVPGPGGALVFLLGAILAATQLRCAATFLDHCDTRLGTCWSRCKSYWLQLSRSGRAVAALAFVTILGTASYYSFRFLFAG